MPTFTEFALVDRDFGSPLNEDVVDNFVARDEELRERPFYLVLADTQETSDSYVQQVAWQLYVPQVAVALNIAIQAYKHNAASGEVECRIGALTSTEVSSTETSFGTVYDCTFSDVSTIVGTEVTLTLWAHKTGSTGGSPHMHVQAVDGPASYFVE